MKFTYLTFNTMGAPLKPKTRWRFEQIGQLVIKLAHIFNIDFITLQETYDHVLRDRTLVDPWRERFQFSACANEKGARMGPSGLTTLSRFEIKDTAFRSYSRGPADLHGNRTKLSNHAYGLAIDINEKNNGLYVNCPKFSARCRLIKGGKYEPGNTLSLSKDHPIVMELQKAKFYWGGELYGNMKDFMHFSPDGL